MKHKVNNKKWQTKNEKLKLICTFSFGRSALVVCNLWRRFRVFISSTMTSSHHSIHFTSLNCSYTSSLSDISPSSFTKGSSFMGFCGLPLFIWTLSLGDPGFPFLARPREIVVFRRFSLSFLEILRPTLAFAFFPRTASSWQQKS